MMVAKGLMECGCLGAAPFRSSCPALGSGFAGPSTGPLCRASTSFLPQGSETWMAGTSPAMTVKILRPSHHRLDARQRRDEIAEGRAADFEIAVLVERRAGRR